MRLVVLGLVVLDLLSTRVDMRDLLWVEAVIGAVVPDRGIQKGPRITVLPFVIPANAGIQVAVPRDQSGFLLDQPFGC